MQFWTKNVRLTMCLNEGDEVYEIERIRLADDVPIASEISCIPRSFVSGMKKEDFESSPYKFL